MQIKDYLDEILGKVAANPYVESQNISFEERPPDTAYITGVITFIDGSRLHIKEFLIFKSEAVSILMYGYNYLSKDDRLIFRYDNASDPKATGLSTYPEHKHTLAELLPAKMPALDEVLSEISESITLR
jgi:hypothetical protein